MTDKQFGYGNQDQTKEVETVLKDADTLDVSTVNLLSGVKYFLKTEQFKLKVSDPSVAGAEVQMKGLAAFFNERRDLMESLLKQIAECKAEVETLVAKLIKNGYAVKAAKVSEATKVLDSHTEEIDDLIIQVNDAKKEQLDELKRKILKAERVRHFKNL